MVNQAKEPPKIIFNQWLTESGIPSVKPNQELMETTKHASAQGLCIEIGMEQNSLFVNMSELLHAGLEHCKFVLVNE
jgi:hypothetical protein